MPPTASLIRGNRTNCALFSTNLDWLVSKLDRLEASSGKKTQDRKMGRLGRKGQPSSPLGGHLAGILEVLYCVLIESPEVLNIIQENHIKSIISLLDKHGRNHKVGPASPTPPQVPDSPASALNVLGLKACTRLANLTPLDL